MFSIKVLMNFTSLPGFPRPLQKIVMSLKDFANEEFTGEVMMKIMQVPYINETFRLLEHPDTEKHFEGKLRNTPFCEVRFPVVVCLSKAFHFGSKKLNERFQPINCQHVN